MKDLIRRDNRSDVHLYENNGTFTCCACLLAKEGGNIELHGLEVYAHLQRHKQSKHRVPKRFMDRMEKMK